MSNKLRAAAQAALKWLRDKQLDTWTYMDSQFYEDRDEHVKELEAALAEPAIKESLTVAVQEPMRPEIKKMYEDYFDKCFRESSAPQRREWIGLTDADFEKEKFVDYNFMAGASFAEAKLKEKNCG